jgi:alpha-amylase/alpha-mannosidase (GH57 family)
MIYWAPLLHFYQPPSQTHWVLKKVCNESYRPIVNLFHELYHAKVTVNINAVLTEMLADHGMSDVIDGLRAISEDGRLEFTGSAMYHPILPLIPQDEVLRQITHNYQSNRRFFGNSYAPQGFFPPEMCYSPDIVKPILDTGHRWIIISGIACPVAWPTNIIYQIASPDDQNLAVFFRDDILSNRISFKGIDAQTFIAQLRGLQGKKKDIYVVTAMDAETFGHHIKRWEQLFLAEVYEAIEAENSHKPRQSQASGQTSEKAHQLAETPDLAAKHGEILRAVEIAEVSEIRVVTLSRLLDLFALADPIKPYPSSWSTSKDDLKAGDPYPLWKSKGNDLHKLQWQHLKIAMELTNKAQQVATSESARIYADIARELLDGALHSDQFWWASRRPMWDINMVHRGILQQREVILNAYKAINMSALPEDEKMEFYYRVIASRDLRSKITDQLLIYP